MRYFMRTDKEKLVRVTDGSGVYKSHPHAIGLPCPIMVNTYKEITATEFAVLRIKGWTVLVSVNIGK